MHDDFYNPKAMKPGNANNYGFVNVPYDMRSGIFVNAGVNYGVGMRQPEGHKGNPKESNKDLNKK